MTNTYVSLATITLTSTDSEIVFSSIPATYQDLIVVVNGQTTAGVALFMRLNNDSTSANYPRVGMAAFGSSAVSFATNEPGVQAAFQPSRNSWILHVMDYSATDKQKTILSRLSQATDEVNAIATRWTNTAAVNEVRFVTASSTFAIGTQFSLYGVAA